MRLTSNLKSPAPTILVVDDEAEVLRVLETMLTGQGYRVILAKNAESAIRTFEQMARKPDLILTDVVMPGTSGPMMVEHLQKSNPDIQVLFMSGYDDRQIVQKYVVERGFTLIPKPFNLEKLAANVKQIIDAAARAVELETAQ